jgi:predicted RNase H-like HicB family nuclease
VLRAGRLQDRSIFFRFEGFYPTLDPTFRSQTFVTQGHWWFNALNRVSTDTRRIMVGRSAPMTLEFTAVFRKVPEGYIGFVEELPGANTQGATLEEARSNLKEAVALVLEANRALAQEEGRDRM